MTSFGSRISTQRHTAVQQLAPALHDATPVLGVIDYNIMDHLIEIVAETYPEDWYVPAVSVATVGLPGVLEHLRARGLAVQTGSAVELDIARHAGYSAAEILHNAPVTTPTHLRDITDAALSFSISNFAELTRVDELLNTVEHYDGRIGLQITPQASTDDNATTFAHRGIGLRDHRTELIEAIRQRSWLTQLHTHFDTPPTTLQQMAEQVAAVYQFAEDVEHVAGARRIHGLHFNAGVPFNPRSEQAVPSLDNHRFIHQAMIPDLVDGKYQCTMDFSDFLTTHATMILARVEYTKDFDDRLIAVVHANALQHPETTRVAVFDADGNHKDTFQQYYYDVAGPNGLVAQGVPLPEVKAGDVLALYDVGTTTVRPQTGFTAPVCGIRADGLLTESTVLATGQSVYDLAKAAGVYQPAKLLY